MFHFLSQQLYCVLSLSLRLCILVPPDTLEEVLARLGSFQLRLMNPLPHPDRGDKDRDTGRNFVTQHEALCGEEQILS